VCFIHTFPYRLSRAGAPRDPEFGIRFLEGWWPIGREEGEIPGRPPWQTADRIQYLGMSFPLSRVILMSWLSVVCSWDETGLDAGK
jgi:hypothetical protein